MIRPLAVVIALFVLGYFWNVRYSTVQVVSDERASLSPGLPLESGSKGIPQLQKEIQLGVEPHVTSDSSQVIVGDTVEPSPVPQVQFQPPLRSRGASLHHRRRNNHNEYLLKRRNFLESELGLAPDEVRVFEYYAEQFTQKMKDVEPEKGYMAKMRAVAQERDETYRQMLGDERFEKFRDFQKKNASSAVIRRPAKFK